MVARVEFFEKPGCAGNAKQRKLLEGLGYTLDVKDMLSEPWTPETLRPFFGDQPIVDWFNKGAKKIKSGAVDPAGFDEAQALATLIADPMLIRRPLLRTEAGCASGFVPGPLLTAIGIAVPDDTTVSEGCQKGEKHECKRPEPVG